MSLVIETIVYCDICGENNGGDDRSKPGWMIRRSRKASGWVNVGAKDYCPQCLAKKAEKEQ